MKTSRASLSNGRVFGLIGWAEFRPVHGQVGSQVERKANRLRNPTTAHENYLEQILLKSVPRRMLSVPQALEKIIATIRLLSNENRVMLVRKDILPAIRILRDHASSDTTPPLLTKSLATMESWANHIAANPTSWRVYAERLRAHSGSLRILAQVQTMGGVSADV